MKCAGEVSDGVFPVWMNPERYDIFEESLNEGFAAAGGGKSLENFEIAPFCTGGLISPGVFLTAAHCLQEI